MQQAITLANVNPDLCYQMGAGDTIFIISCELMSSNDDVSVLRNEIECDLVYNSPQYHICSGQKIYIYIWRSYIALFPTNHIHRKTNHLHTQQYRLQFVGGYQGRQSLIIFPIARLMSYNHTFRNCKFSTPFAKTNLWTLAYFVDNNQERELTWFKWNAHLFYDFSSC